MPKAVYLAEARNTTDPLAVARVPGPAPRVVPREVTGTPSQKPPTIHGGGSDRPRSAFPRPRRRITGYVYLIGLVDGCHKVGRSKDPERRAWEFSSLPSAPELVTAIATDYSGWLENCLHEAFSQKHVFGEWFRLTPEDVSLFRSMQVVNSPEDVHPEVVERWHNRVPGFLPGKTAMRRIRLWLPTDTGGSELTTITITKYAELRAEAKAVNMTIQEYIRQVAVPATQTVSGRPRTWSRLLPAKQIEAARRNILRTLRVGDMVRVVRITERYTGAGTAEAVGEGVVTKVLAKVLRVTWSDDTGPTTIDFLIKNGKQVGAKRMKDYPLIEPITEPTLARI